MQLEGSSPLIIRINAKLKRIGVELEKAERCRTLQGFPDLSDLVTSQTALAIHNIYTGIESILEDVGLEMDGGVPAVNGWHGHLLDQLSEETPIRQPVIPENLLEITRDIMRFRDFLSTACGVELRKPEIDKKYADLRDLVIPGVLEGLEGCLPE